MYVSLSVYICIYMYVCTCVCIYIHNVRHDICGLAHRHTILQCRSKHRDSVGGCRYGIVLNLLVLLVQKYKY